MSGFNVHDYSDILRIPHHQSDRHPRMTLLNRAAQFSPFAALTGYDDAIMETGRLTDKKRELSEEEQHILNERMAMLEEHLSGLSKGEERPEVEIEYYVPDGRKAGGSYNRATVRVKRVDEVVRELVLTNGQRIPLDNLFSLNSAVFIDYAGDYPD